MVRLFAGGFVADLGAILDLWLPGWNHLGERRRVGDPVETLLGGRPLLDRQLVMDLPMAFLGIRLIVSWPFDRVVKETDNLVTHEVFGAEDRAGALFLFLFRRDSCCGTGPMITAVLRLRWRRCRLQVSHVDEFSDPPQQVVGETALGREKEIDAKGKKALTDPEESSWTAQKATSLSQWSTASLSHLRTMLPESSSRPLPDKRPNHATY